MKNTKKTLFILIFSLLFIAFFYDKPIYATEGISNNGVYIITSRNSRKCLNVNYGTDANGTNVTQYTQDGSTEQKWKLVSTGTNTFKIYAMCSSNGTNRVLDVLRTNGSASGSIVSGNNVDIWAPNDNAAQEFVIEKYTTDNNSTTSETGEVRNIYTIRLKSNTNLALTSFGLRKWFW